jgi:pimeloyl-ACP methyl ester carboxylesterase
MDSSWVEQFPGNFAWSNATLVTKGMVPYGAVAMREIDETCARLKLRHGDPDAWREEWCAMGSRLEKLGNEAQAAGRRTSAGHFFLRAGMYWFTGERFLYPGEQKRALGRKALELQQAGLLSSFPNIEKVEVPFEGKTLPALFMKAPAHLSSGAARRPTVVVFDGMDNCKEMSVLFCGLEFAARGWNTLAIDGPGQGESLRLRELYARHDYEAPGGAAYDYVASRSDSDPAKVVAMGYSFGGYYAGRIAAMDKRFAAGVAFAALHWDLAGFQREVKRKQEIDPKATAQSTFHFRWVMGCLDDADAAIRKAEKFSLAEVAGNITKPFLVVHGADDKVVPVANAIRMYEAIGAKRKHLKIFTGEEGGSGHALVDNRPLGVDYIADWLGEVLQERG